MNQKNHQAEEFQFQAEMSQLLHLITHSLYSHREIFLRELISNSSDALSKLHFNSLTDPNILGDDGELKIKIDLDEENKTLSISDNGVGMSKEELMANLGTIAKSGTAGFVSQLTGDAKKDVELIGRFGVGFYAVFMVADEVSVESRSYADPQGHRWVSEGTGTYSVEAVDDLPRGTKISFTLKEDAAEFGSKYRVESIIKKYSDFVSFPIELNGEAANQSKALWARPKSEVSDEEYTEFFNYLSHGTGEPLAHLHLDAEAPVQFKALLYLPQESAPHLFNPEERDSKINLYVKRVFIQSDCKELLPAWMRFVVGVVDSEDLTLNVSREVTQHSPVMAKINQYLTKKVMGLLADWAKKDEEKYLSFWKSFGNYVKEGIHTDYGNRDKLLELYRCQSSAHPDRLTSLAGYVERMKPEQEEIYYVFGKNRQAIENSPNIEYFKKNEIEVLYLIEEIDEFVLSGVGQYKEKSLVTIDKADLKLEDNQPEEEKESLQDSAKEQILERFKTTLGERVGEVIPSQRLVDSAATLVAPKDSMGANMERMMKMMDQNFQGSKRVMEINLSHRLIQNLAQILEKDAADSLIDDVIVQLYEGAALLEGNLENPTEMVPRANRLMAMAAELHLKSLA
ncbi:MAG: molecular chaperone HtpG [bacterium]|nr:molecular chaperone HtpG [bacterium]